MTALEMYREDLAVRRDAENRTPRQEYFIRLRDTLHQELAVDGRSEFLEEMISGCTGAALPALEFAVLRECFAAIVDGRRMKDASQHVPHILRGPDAPLTWAEMEKHPGFRVDDAQMPEMLLRLRNISWQLVSARDQTPAVMAERAVSREIAGLRAVNRALEEDNRALRTERDELLERVTVLEEGVITRQLQNKIDARRYQMESDLAAEMALKRAQAEQEMHSALMQAAQQEQQGREAARREAMQEDARRAAACAAHTRELLETLDERLQEYRKRLAEADYHFLAQAYAGLLATTSRETPALVGQAQAHGADEQFLQQLAAFSAQLNVQMNRMEQALLQLGLQVVSPEAGSGFDSQQHSPANATGSDGPAQEQEIASVETPGMQTIDADGQASTLLRPVVRTRRRSAAYMSDEQ
ncbi:MAG: hypothetical protein IJE07_09555 [Clostridia bacterium]|nr:hypothetical protein [Clostridia bacterium]